MANRWYLRKSGQTLGPLSYEQLAELAQQGKLKPQTLVSRAGEQDWQPADRIDGLFVPSDVPPPPPIPTAPVPVAASAPAAANKVSLREVAVAQKWLLWGILAGLTTFVSWPLLFVVIPFQMYCIVRLASAVQWSVGKTVAWIVLGLIPYFGLLLLLLLNQQATKRLQAAGIRVGFMGARLADVPPA